MWFKSWPKAYPTLGLLSKLFYQRLTLITKIPITKRVSCLRYTIFPCTLAQAQSYSKKLHLPTNVLIIFKVVLSWMLTTVFSISIRKPRKSGKWNPPCWCGDVEMITEENFTICSSNVSSSRMVCSWKKSMLSCEFLLLTYCFSFELPNTHLLEETYLFSLINISIFFWRKPSSCSTKQKSFSKSAIILA